MNSSCKSSQPTSAGIDPLESRRLLSASWTTSDAPWAAEDLYTGSSVDSMAADAAGNAYALGTGFDPATGSSPPVIREKPAGSSSWTTIVQGVVQGYWISASALAVDANGDLFVNASGPNKSWTVLERPAPTAANPQPALVTIDSVSTGWAGTEGSALAVDAAGNVFTGGMMVTSSRGFNWTIRKGMFNSSTGRWTFSTVDQFKYGNDYGPSALAVVNSGASAGVYAVGDTGASPRSWMVRKSANGGSTWSTVDMYKYDSTGGNASASGVVGDSAGNVYVVGSAQQAVITGYTKNKSPIYSYSNHWIVRKSADGGASWTRDDDYGSGEATAVCADPTGAVYVAGESGNDAIVRTNAGGSWNTVDDYASGYAGLSAWYNAIAVDSSGNHYAGGYSDVDNGWLIRTDAPAAPTTVASTTIFSSTSIGSSSSSTHDSLFGVISPSTDVLS